MVVAVAAVATAAAAGVVVVAMDTVVVATEVGENLVVFHYVHTSLIRNSRRR